MSKKEVTITPPPRNLSVMKWQANALERLAAAVAAGHAMHREVQALEFARDDLAHLLLGLGRVGRRFGLGQSLQHLDRLFTSRTQPGQDVAGGGRALGHFFMPAGNGKDKLSSITAKRPGLR